jgi:hypothetical protein
MKRAVLPSHLRRFEGLKIVRHRMISAAGERLIFLHLSRPVLNRPSMVMMAWRGLEVAGPAMT